MKKFLASVGNAQLLGKKDGKLFHIADVRTLTESSLSIQTSMEDVRAGQGAKLYGRFAHTSGMTVNMTDAMFDLNYVALQVGAEIEGNATAFYSDEGISDASTAGHIHLSKTPAKIGNACGLDKIVVWAREKGCDASDEWIAIVMDTASTELSLAGTTLAGKKAANLCVRYFTNRPEARQIAVKGNFIPSECVLILTTNMFAGDANARETGKAAGTLTVKIPRFQLNGQFDLSMAMTSASSTSLQGTALTVDDGSCDNNGVYAEIVEVETGTTALTNLKEIALDEETLATNDEEYPVPAVVYGLYYDGHISQLNHIEDGRIMGIQKGFGHTPVQAGTSIMVSGTGTQIVYVTLSAEGYAYAGEVTTDPTEKTETTANILVSYNGEYYVSAVNAVYTKLAAKPVFFSTEDEVEIVTPTTVTATFDPVGTYGTIEVEVGKKWTDIDGAKTSTSLSINISGSEVLINSKQLFTDDTRASAVDSSSEITTTTYYVEA